MINTQTKLTISGIIAGTMTIISLFYGLGINSLPIGFGIGLMTFVMIGNNKPKERSYSDFIREEEYAREKGRIMAREDFKEHKEYYKKPIRFA